MQLSDLLPSELAGLVKPNPSIAGIACDSRKVGTGFLFGAWQGAKGHGMEYARQAVQQGAAAILTDQGNYKADDLFQSGVAVIPCDNPRRVFALAAARFYHQQPDHCVAVTGTSGKTSVASLTRQILSYCGHKAAALGTIGITTDEGTHYGSLTTPDPASLHATLADLAGQGITHLAMEASSHGLDQHRLDGVTLQAAAFTNLGRDHMDYHPTMEDYFQAKARLFTELLPDKAPAIIWADTQWGQRMADVARQAGRDVKTVGEKGHWISLQSVRAEGFRQHLTFVLEGEVMQASLPLAGSFQAANALVSLGLCLAIGCDRAKAVKALEHISGIPGRLELVGLLQHGAHVFVDYAHKPDAVENVLKALRPMTKGRLFIVLGAGGDRDKGKRELMGRAAAAFADQVIITDDNPRSEDPDLIRKAIQTGAPDAQMIADRAVAIESAIVALQPGDALVVAGKGHETGQIIGDKVLPFSDHDVIKTVIQKNGL
jgi:UDP-N-acetylmuramoyl-L-alanyl-D-glutamate--2,6-diaminopimelate ligase